MATQDYTNGVTLTDAAEFERFDCVAYSVLSGVAGTNTITATGPATYTYAATRPPVWFVPAATNTGATTINITPSGGAALGAKNVFANGAACVGGELVSGVPVGLVYDGTQYNIIGGFATFPDSQAVVKGATDATKKIRFEVDGLTAGTTRVLTPMDTDYTIGSRIILGTEQATTSGTSIDFTGIPAGVRRITVMFNAVSTNGTDNWLIQLGDSGGVETTGYVAEASNQAGTLVSSTSGFVIGSASAANSISGAITLSLQDSSDNTWVGTGIVRSNTTNLFHLAGVKALSAVLDRVRITTTGGTNAFDAGAINISYEF